MTCIEMKLQFLKIIALYFSCVMVKILKDFRVIANAWENSKLVSFNSILAEV